MGCWPRAEGLLSASKAAANGYNAVGLPIAAGVLYALAGVLLSPMIAGGAMALSSLSVVFNSNRLRTYKRPTLQSVEVTVEVGREQPSEDFAQAQKENEKMADTKVKDPVCGMDIDISGAVASMGHEGKTYYFCSHDCHAKFMADPGQYAS